MSGDWQCGKSLAECNQYMLDHEINTDVTFIVDNKDDEDNTGSNPVSFKAHKYMLVSRSPVFYTMLYGVMAEQGYIRVEDARPEDFKNLLSYIYTDAIDFQPPNVFGIMYLSKKYILPQLTRKSIEYLHSILSVENACLILDQSLIYDDETLIAKCLKMIQLHTDTVFTTETMLDIKNETLMKILDCDALKLKESDVFNACVRWANHQLKLKQVEATGENIRNVLGDCIHKIGYANMGSKDFACLVVPQSILQMEEENAIFRYMACQDLHPPPPNFLCTKRSRAFPREIVVSDQIETTRIADMSVKVTLTNDTNLEIKSLFVGRCTQKEEISNIYFDENKLNVTAKVNVSGKKQEWKFDTPVTLQKDKQHSLKFMFWNSLVNGNGPVYVVKTSEIVAADEIVEVKLQSSASFMPLLGFSYTLAIPK